MASDNTRQNQKSIVPSNPACAAGIIPKALPLLFMAVLIGALGWPLWQYVRVRVMYSETRCTILSAHLADETDAEGITSYWPEISFTYDVNGVKFYSNVYAPYSRTGDIAAVKYIVARYRQLKESTCWYDPSNPIDAMLIRGLGPLPWWQIVMSALTMLLLIVYSLRELIPPFWNALVRKRVRDDQGEKA